MTNITIHIASSLAIRMSFLQLNFNFDAKNIYDAKQHNNDETKNVNFCNLTHVPIKCNVKLLRGIKILLRAHISVIR